MHLHLTKFDFLHQYLYSTFGLPISWLKKHSAFKYKSVKYKESIENSLSRVLAKSGRLEERRTMLTYQENYL